MDNNLSTDKQLVAIIQNTEWIDLSPSHKKLRLEIENSIQTACVKKDASSPSPIMVKGAFGIGKTATLYYMFHYAWTKLGVPAFLLNLEDAILEIKKYLSENNIEKLPNNEVSKVFGNFLTKQVEILKTSHFENINGGQIYFPSFDIGNLLEYLSKFRPARLHTSDNGEYSDEELPLFDMHIITNAVQSKNKYLLLIDEFETKYQELKRLIESSGGGELRQFFDDVASISSTNFYCIIGNGPASGYELNQDLKEKADDVAAQQGRLSLMQINMATVSSLSKSFLKGYQKEHINFIWWLSRVRPRQIKKLKMNLQPIEDLKENNYIQFIRDNKVLNEPLDESIGDSSITFLKTDLFEDLSINLKDLIKNLLINIGPYVIDIQDDKIKDELVENKELFYASTETKNVSNIITALQEDIIKIRDKSNKYAQISFDSLHIYIDLILSSISNQENEMVFGVINKDVDEYLSKSFLTPLFGNLYDFITIYEDEHDKKIKLLLDFILELIHKSENEDVETQFSSCFDLFEEGSVKLKREDKIQIQLNLNAIRETIEQPIGSPKLPYKSESLSTKISEVNSVEKIFIWNKTVKEEIIIIPNYENQELLESYLETLTQYFQENWDDKKNYFGNGELLSNVIYLEENEKINNFKDWLCFSNGKEELPYKLKRLDIKHIDSYLIHNSQRISDFISSLTEIATVGLNTGEIAGEKLRNEYASNEPKNIIRIDKIVDVILDATWTESKQTRRTIEYYKDLLLVGDNSVLESLIKLANKSFSDALKEIIPCTDKMKNSLLKISVEDKIFEEAHSSQTKNLFNFLIAEIEKENLTPLISILKNLREFKFRPSPENRENEVSLVDLFFSFEKNNKIGESIDDYKNSSISKYLTRFSQLLSDYSDVNSLSDMVNAIYQNKTNATSYFKALNFYESNIPYLNGFYYLALSERLDYDTEVIPKKEELENIQKEFNDLEGELSDLLYELKELTLTESELNYNLELRTYNTNIIQPLLQLIKANSNISYLILTEIVCRYLRNSLKRANRFKTQIMKLIGEITSKKTIIDAKQNEYDLIFEKSEIHRKLVSKNKTKNFFYGEKFVKSFKIDNTFHLIFGDLNKFKPSDKYYIDDNEFDLFLASIKRSFDKKLPEINKEIEEVKEIDAEIEEVLKIEESISTLITTEENE